ncbi:MAG TPA: phospho-N-acetylmuramoyl-pentapeptide-transferase, partial [Acidimicrobiales bacterium]
MIPLLTAGAIGLLVSLLGTRYLIDWLRAHRVGQPIHEDVPDGHTTKAGTPTMGGVAIVVAAVIGYAAAHVHGGLVFTRSGVLVMMAIAGSGVVGALDDWIKVSHERNLGLSMRAKMGGLLVVAVGFAVATLAWTDVETTLSFTRWSEPGWELHDVGWAVLAVLLIAGTTNAVNLTDGLDGLAAGSSIYAFGAMTVVGFWAFRHPDVYQVNHALDLAVIAAA